MSSPESRLARLEDMMRPEAKPMVIVDNPESTNSSRRGPSDPVEREAWLQGQIPEGARDVVIIRVVRGDRPDWSALDAEETS